MAAGPSWPPVSDACRRLNCNDCPGGNCVCLCHETPAEREARLLAADPATLDLCELADLAFGPLPPAD